TLLSLSIVYAQSPSVKKIQSKDINFTELVEELNLVSAPIYKQALEYIRKEELNKAIIALNEIISITPYDPRAYASLSLIYIKAKQFDDFLKILELAGRNQTSYDLIFEKLAAFNLIKEDPQNINQKIFIAPFKNNKKAAISFLFDDGRRSVYTHALPLFDKYNLKATILINPKTTPPEPTSQFDGSWTEWRDATKRGHEIGNHGYSHFDLTKLSEDDLEKEVNVSFSTITEKLGRPPISFAFPFDKFNTKTLAKVLERHIAVRVHDYLTQHYENIFIPSYGGKEFSTDTAQKFVEMAMIKKLWLVAECHEIQIDNIKSYKPMTSDFLETHLAYLKENENNLWIDTFSNIFIYLAQRKAASLTIKEETANTMTFSLKTTIAPKVPQIPLTIVINTAPTMPNAVKATIKETGQLLETRIKDGQILLNTPPQKEDILVEWN
ncbi:MAG: polysaccharide deacetylase family protein, partial [Candidatus Omnitrophica bacterium]|nr:polysaccharide deacetylase family protein [Candidatus Omnitrophota bacterium]